MNTPAEIVVRDAIIEDASVIATLLGELGYPSQTEGVRARLARLLAREGSRVFVAERSAKALGVLGLHRMPVLTSLGDIAMIIALVVTERARGAGVGRLLVARAEEQARVLQCERIMVTSAERRADAHAFYQHLGYGYTGRRFAKGIGI
jgi:N-acetylglutamate synthase-like GNAT family acetyltransferase